MGKKQETVKFWVLKISIATLIITTGISVLAEMFLNDLPIIPASLIVLLLVSIGVVFDVIGVAFATCDKTPFVSMASRKVKKARRALKLLRSANMVASVCNDVVGDICGIVSGAAGAAIAVKLAMDGDSVFYSIAVSSIVAALTVGGKAVGKKLAMHNNVKIVEMISAFLCTFERDKKK